MLGREREGDGEIQGLFKLWPVLSSRSDEEQLRKGLRVESSVVGCLSGMQEATVSIVNTQRGTLKRKKGVGGEERGRIVYLDTHREDKEAQVIQQG